MEKMATECWRGCNVIAVDVEGASGGLSILWNTNKISLFSFFTTRHTISSKFQPIGYDQSGYISNVYRPKIMQDKLTFLQSLSLLSPLLEIQPWIIGGDFNIINFLPDKRGGLNHLDQDSKIFKETTSNLGLVDWETTNGNFTWSKHRVEKNQIASRMDFFLISKSHL
jgi:exonuclease III